MSKTLTQDEYCRRFVEYMVREAGKDKFDNGQSVIEYAEFIAPRYWADRFIEDDPEASADADMDCWED